MKYPCALILALTLALSGCLSPVAVAECARRDKPPAAADEPAAAEPPERP